MSVCKFLAADIPLQEVRPLKDYPVHMILIKELLMIAELMIISSNCLFLTLGTIPIKSMVYVWNGIIQMDVQNRF